MAAINVITPINEAITHQIGQIIAGLFHNKQLQIGNFHISISWLLIQEWVVKLRPNTNCNTLPSQNNSNELNNPVSAGSWGPQNVIKIKYPPTHMKHFETNGGVTLNLKTQLAALFTHIMMASSYPIN